MNRILRVLPLTSLLLLPLAAQDGAKTELKIAAKPGTVVALVAKMRQQQSIDMGGKQMEANHELVHDIDAKVAAVSGDGVLTLEVTFKRIRGAFELPRMDAITFDTRPAAGKGDGKEEAADAGADVGVPDAASLRTAMTGLTAKSFQATVSPQGKVTDLSGIAPALQAARQQLGANGAQMLRGTLDEGAIKTLLGGAFGPLPKEAIAVGGSWDSDEAPSTSGLPTTRKSTMTLSRCDEAQAEIKVVGTVEARPRDPKAPALQGDNAMFAEAKIQNGKIGGKVVLSRLDGFVVHSESTTSMDVTAPGPMGGDANISVKTTTTIDRRQPDAEDEAGKQKATGK